MKQALNTLSQDTLELQKYLERKAVNENYD